MDREPASIRAYRPGDLDDLYRICLLTAGSGQDGTSLYRDPRLPGHVYAGPYGLFEPSLAFVAEDAAGVGGYIVAALDIDAFGQRLERDWWPILRARYPEPGPEPAEEISLQEQGALQNIHDPFTPPREVTERFPSHLHINLLPRMQGRGTGRQLIATLLSGLRDRGSPGVHLLVRADNQRAVSFYRHLGFTDVPDTAYIFTMDLRAPAR